MLPFPGPLVGGLVNRFGCRPVAIAGSLLGAVSLVLSTLAPNVIVFILVYGVIGGLGFGMVFLPAIVCVGLYFESKRALATGIAVCGAGVGAFVFAPLASYLVDNFGWRNSNLIFAGLASLNVLCGLVMRPLEAVKMDRDMEDTAAGDERSKKNSVKTIDPMPTIGEDEIFDEEEEAGDFMYNNNNDPSSVKTQIVRNLSLNNANSGAGDKFSRNYSTPYLRPVPSSFSIMSSRDPGERMGSGTAPVIKPLSRVDIFYSGSIRQINDEHIDTEIRGLQTNRQSFVSIAAGSRGSSNSLVIPRNSLILDTTAAQTNVDVLDLRKSENAFVNALKTMLNPALMTDPKFVLIGISNLFGFLGFFVPFLYLPSLASSLNSISPDQASLLVSVIGISNTVGRIGCGYISDFACVDSLAVTNISFFLTGVCIIVFPLLSSFTEFIILSLVFGLCIAALVTLTSIVLVDVLGLEKLTSAFGLLIMFRGAATIMGPPLAGLVQEWAGNYDMSFKVAGAFLIMAGLVSVIADIVRRRDKRGPAELN